MTSRVQEYLSSVPIVTRSLLIINISIHMIIFLFTYPIFPLTMNPALVVFRGEYYRVISSAFVHGSFLHILMNMSSLIPLGTALESQFGSLKFLLITIWTILMCGVIFCILSWFYSLALGNPGAMNNNAVGYSGVLFCYALIESFHSVELTRSVFGIFSVPTKSYPVILLVLLQIILPQISLFGHLSGLLFGVIIISRVGNNLFMPSNDTLHRMDAWSCLSCCTRQTSYTLTKDKELVHSSLEMGGAGNACTMCWGTTQLVLWHIWNAIITVLYIVGFPTDRVCECIRSFYNSVSAAIYTHCCLRVYNLFNGSSSGTYGVGDSTSVATSGGGGSGSNSRGNYARVQTVDTDSGGTAGGGNGSTSRSVMAGASGNNSSAAAKSGTKSGSGISFEV